MFRSKYIYIASMIVLLPLLGGCGKSLQYNPQAIHHLNSVSADSHDTKNDVTVLIKRFDSQMNEHFFNKPNLKTVPYQLTVNNQSTDDLTLSSEQINIPLEPLNKIKADITPSFGRSVGMFFIPLGGLNLIVGGIYTYNQFKTKDRISNDLTQKTIPEFINIPAGKKFSTILFINPTSLRPRMCMNLVQSDNQNKVYDFNLSLC